MLSLTGVRVLEVAELVAAPYAAKLLADLGADVIKVEPPEGDESRRRGPFPPDAPGDPEQSGLFLGTNTNKRSITLDLDTGSARQRLGELVSEADIVIHSLGRSRANAVGLDGEAVLAIHPALVVCAITPFGHTGPHADWLGERSTSFTEGAGGT